MYIQSTSQYATTEPQHHPSTRTNLRGRGECLVLGVELLDVVRHSRLCRLLGNLVSLSVQVLDVRFVRSDVSVDVLDYKNIILNTKCICTDKSVTSKPEKIL